MKILKIVNWVVRIIILALLVVLMLDNLQTTTFNFFGIYKLTLPLIIIALIFMGLGILIGLLVSLFRSFELKAKISMLEKELKRVSITPSASITHYTE
ncbi:MAG: LapA family protein [Neisseriaceae bacterium]|jgi:uncharacterized integral membrane protein